MGKIYCSTILSLDILLLLISIIIFAKSVVVKSTPVLCNQTKSWKLGGQDIVANSRGFVLLVVLMPMQCEHCHKQLIKFQTIMETLPEIRIVVVAPYDENSHLIERYRREFPRIVIGMESLNERIWDILSGSVHDHFIYDRCGRLASFIRHPKSDTTKFEHTLWALKLAVNYAQCGWCQYDPSDLPVPQKAIVTTHAASVRNSKAKKTRINAVVYPQNDRRYDVNSDRQPDIASQHESLSLQTNTIAPVHKDNARISDHYILPLSLVATPPATVENNQKMVISDSESQQQQRISLSKKEITPQQTQPKFEDGQRRAMIQSVNSASEANDWRISNGLTVSRQFPDQIRQDENQHHEHRKQQQQTKKEHRQEQRKKQQRYRQQNGRKRKEEYEYALEELRLQEQHRQRIRQQEEEQRKIQEQRRRLQEIQRHHEERHQAQQRFHQQELEKRTEEQRRLQKQKTESEFYTDVSDEEHENQGYVEDESNWQLFKNPLYRHDFHDYATTSRVLFGSISPAKKTSPLYDVDDEENDYDYSKMNSETTAAPIQRTQISETESPEHSPFLFEHQVPCAAFTDKICIDQKRRMGVDKMSKCCDKGIYLTDLCVPGYCTNITIELCCMQKFLQAKYKCCMNNSKEINSPGDAFSRCCFDKFVRDDDKCCPARLAKFHWLSAHEICLPNVRVDLSDLRFSMVNTARNNQYPGTSNDNHALNDVITIDLNVDRSWDHNCEQGAKVLQFPYLPFDELVDEEEKDGSSEKRR